MEQPRASAAAIREFIWDAYWLLAKYPLWIRSQLSYLQLLCIFSKYLQPKTRRLYSQPVTSYICSKFSVMQKLKTRWGITSNFQLTIIFIVFAITGSSAAYLSKPILKWFGIVKEDVSLWIYYPLYIILIFPVYQVLLISFGFIFGQFKFFWTFEKKMLRAMKLGFLLPKEENMSKDESRKS